MVYVWSLCPIWVCSWIFVISLWMLLPTWVTVILYNYRCPDFRVKWNGYSQLLIFIWCWNFLLCVGLLQAVAHQSEYIYLWLSLLILNLIYLANVQYIYMVKNHSVLSCYFYVATLVFLYIFRIINLARINYLNAGQLMYRKIMLVGGFYRLT